MNYTEVNGKSNGSLHSMTAGNMTLSGDIWPVNQDPGAAASPNTVYIVVYQDVTGTDRNVGSTSILPNSNGSLASFSKNFSNQVAGNYYLFIYKVNDDGWNIKGSGSLITN